MSDNMKNRNILISGASIAGPALAYWLNKYGFNVTVVEKAPALRKGGYRVDLRGAAVEVADRMGILNDVKQKNTAMLGSSMIDANGKRYADLNDPNIFGMRQQNDVEIMRGELSEILYNATKNETEYLFDNGITGLSQSEEQVTVILKNGEQRDFDLVIAADGLRSNTRNMVFGRADKHIAHLGYYVCIFTIPNHFELDHWELSYPALNKVVNVYSTGKKQEAKAFFLFASHLVDIDHRDTDSQKKLVIDNFREDGGIISNILDAIYTTTDFYFDSVSQVQMDTLFNKRVALLGDAGYCPSPASGQGSSLALVGAYVLAGELAAANGDHRIAFKNYEKQMDHFINMNRKLGVTILKDLVSKSKIHLWFQTTMLRLLLKLPGKEKIFRSFLKEMQQAVDEAANAIELKDYEQGCLNDQHQFQLQS
ncbi:2-polyprenyl-6-methoxyphenol hydroxylase [Mucilaginibacter pineti]|uniref:2-polyprenyl-6-methoxyphenol hydroxylase n=1 Tax=Mucilaginibacter pineti TaxID=1391627 RepID=A0A1G6SZ53_9SPHI|nr:FAD-dependent monooxygenase [Mucilaginibacter pineti]SDD21991.1 2-polyprenyl-6-methoxyphenol hydroxylase [Mucilaginibacter pineti]